ncbi:MAG TPA: glycosyltransferase family 2 protein [Kiritimatiellia bacterium]|nr:glycosyltransferase family 2 protein [Kiritimatiellia bacterium]
MTIHVVLLNWNQGEPVRTLVQRLLSWTSLPLQPWIVDNASTDQASRLLPSDFPQVNHFRNEFNLGYAGGINTALTAIKEVAEPNDLILLLNNDIQIVEETLTVLQDCLAQHPDAGMIGPVLLEGSSENPGKSWGGRNIGDHIYTRISKPPSFIPEDGCIPVDYVPGTILLFRKSLLDLIGLLDEDFFFSGEIADYALRARKAGQICLVCTGVEVAHHAHDEHGHRGTLYLYYSLRNRFLYIRKHAANHKWLFIKWSVLGLGMAARQLLGGNLSGIRAVMLALTDGWRNKFGNRNELFTR